MANSSARLKERMELREWVLDPDLPAGGYWYASSVPEERHGRFSTYNNWGCRCRPCKRANSDHSKSHQESVP